MTEETNNSELIIQPEQQEQPKTEPAAEQPKQPEQTNKQPNPEQNQEQPKKEKKMVLKDFTTEELEKELARRMSGNEQEPEPESQEQEQAKIDVTEDNLYDICKELGVGPFFRHVKGFPNHYSGMIALCSCKQLNIKPYLHLLNDDGEEVTDKEQATTILFKVTKGIKSIEQWINESHPCWEELIKLF